MPQFLRNPKLVIIMVIIMVMLTTGAKCGALPAGQEYGAPEPISLNYWKVYEDSYNISEVKDSYQAFHPHISINYRNLNYAEYKDELLKAFAKDQGPDIFSIHSTWLREYEDFISPMPAQVTIGYKLEKGTFKKETFTEYRTRNTLNLRQLRDLYPDVVYENQIINNQIYGLPLSIDTLALYYNRDLLNNAGIVEPPKDWDDFTQQVISLTRQDFKGNVVQSGAAIGTPYNVERAFDIISLLMMQSGTQMTTDTGVATFDKRPQGYTREQIPAAEALEFYTSFASPAKQVYTWNERMQNSLQAFMAGKTAFFFGYAYHMPIITAQAPKIDFGVTQMPQAGSAPVNYANYWIEVVSKKSKHPDEAWDFILYSAAEKDNNIKFLKASKKPAALKSLITEQQEDIDLAPFANQLLTAKSWYKGNNALKAEDIFLTMINDALEGLTDTDKIIILGAQKINQIR